MTKLGLKGTMFASNIMGKNLDDPSFEPLWATAEELGAFVFIHPEQHRRRRPAEVVLSRQPDRQSARHHHRRRCLIFGGVMDRHPKLKVMLAHGGGFTPYQAARWEHGWAVRPEPKKNVQAAAEEYRAALPSTTPSCIRTRRSNSMIGLVGVDRVMLGSDYPYDMGHARLRRARARPEDLRRGQGRDPARHVEKLLAGGRK